MRGITLLLGLLLAAAVQAEPPGATGMAGAVATNGFLVLERGAFHVERGQVRVCPDLKSITAPNGQVGCFATVSKAMGLAKQYTPEPSLSLEEMLRNGFPKQATRLTGISYNKERHELVVYYRID